jgi:hypothetical protein
MNGVTNVPAKPHCHILKKFIAEAGYPGCDYRCDRDEREPFE